MPIRVIALANKRAEILIHEPIGENWYGDGLTSRRFVKDLEALGDIEEILVRINSPGGAVFDGIAIYNALKFHKATKEVIVEGLAASAASFIAMVGDTITMGRGAMMMIHNPWTIAMGDADDMRQCADMLEKVCDSLIDIYEDRTAIDRDEIKSMLDAETWLTAKAAVEKGFADEWEDDEEDDEEASKEAARIREANLQAFKAFAATAALTPRRIAAAVRKSASAGAIKLEAPMPEKTSASAANTDKQFTAEDVEAARRQGAEADEARRKAVRVAFGRYATTLPDLLNTCEQDPKCTVELARQKILEELGKQTENIDPTPSSVSAGKDAIELFIVGAGKALEIRAGLEKRDPGNEYLGHSLCDIAARALSLRGVSVRGLTKDGIARKVLATHTTSDFPALLGTNAGKVLKKAYGNFADTWRLWAAKGSVSDFKIAPRIQMGSFNNLATIPEGGEYTYGSLNETYENAQALTKGKAIKMTRQMLVNDDLGGFMRRAQIMGRAAARTVNVDAYAYLTSGASNHGPTTQDGGQYFNATAPTFNATTQLAGTGHGNLTSSGTAISIASLGVGKATLRKQKDVARREALNIQPAVLIVAVGKEDLARQIITSETDLSNANSQAKNVLKDFVTVASDPYLDDISATAWYLFASPEDAAYAFEIVFLDGNEEPYTDDMIEWETDAMAFKVRMDYGVAPGDWRGAYKNVGA